MELTKKQSDGLSLILKRYKDGEKYSVLAGFAGSGKSTLIKFIVEALATEGIDPDSDIAYACYCGKAVQVLIDKGNKNAITLHKLLYDAAPTKDGKFFFKKKPIGSLGYKIIIVDEVSMVSQDFVDLLLSHPCHVIFCGDPQQLGAVKGNGNTLLNYPHVFLSEIHRQAAESGIIQLSMLIREGKPFRNFKSDDAMVLSKSSLNTGMLLWADQIICATNATRISLNTQVRQLKGYTKPIEEGESLICLTNEWDVLSDKGNALTNGTIGTITNMFDTWQEYPKYLQVKNDKVPLIGGTFISNTGDNFGGIFADKQCIITGTPYLDGRTKYRIGKVKKYQDTIPYEFTYSYAATCWKFQGSSARKILGFEEKFPYDKDEHRRYLYTLVTRAEDRCVLLVD